MRSCAIIVSLAIAVGWTVQGSYGQGQAVVEGTWLVTSLSSNGKTRSGNDVEITLTFAGSSYEQTVGGRVTEQGTFRLDPERKPMAIDFVTKEGPVQKTQPGIAEVSDGTLNLHLNQFGADARPTDFNLLPGHVLIVARRIR